MTTAEAINQLKKLDPEGKLPLVKIGWFGEAFIIETFSKTKTYTEIAAIKCGEKTRINFEAIEISVPDIGDEPD